MASPCSFGFRSSPSTHGPCHADQFYFTETESSIVTVRVLPTGAVRIISPHAAGVLSIVGTGASAES